VRKLSGGGICDTTCFYCCLVICEIHDKNNIDRRKLYNITFMYMLVRLRVIRLLCLCVCGCVCSSCGVWCHMCDACACGVIAQSHTERWITSLYGIGYSGGMTKNSHSHQKHNCIPSVCVCVWCVCVCFV
jgi:hypothetical protein